MTLKEVHHKEYPPRYPIQYNYIVKNIAENSKETAYEAFVPAFNMHVYGDTLTELEDGIRFGIETEIQEYTTLGKSIPEPEKLQKYSGNIALRINKKLHGSLKAEAKMYGVSTNKYIEDILWQRHNLLHTSTKK